MQIKLIMESKCISSMKKTNQVFLMMQTPKIESSSSQNIQVNILTFCSVFRLNFSNVFVSFYITCIVQSSQPSCQKNRHLLEFYMSHRGIIDLSRSFQSRHQYISNRHCLLFYFSKVRPYLFGRYLRF